MTTLLLTAGGAIIALIIAFFQGRLTGAKAERVKQMEAENKARTIADEIDNDVGALPSGKAREELIKWGPKK